ncbi:MAG: hypothetical protein GY714_06180 [Desulfobacterales bacterium]|nr:hypothetical protein [Desulfobacterales bacterium]MCP4162481.1 hypothetical protein [Deltaproteobacteria bacterium]
MKYLQRVRIENAKKHLEKGLKTFEEIIYDVSYEDSSTFSRIFLKNTGSHQSFTGINIDSLFFSHIIS